MKKGFTLIELSIALVIIGLLIGGILVGQSLVESAKINARLKKLTQYSIAFVTFKQKFNQEAGDSDHFTPAGNNDKEATSTGQCNDPWYYDGYTAWSHLSQSQILKEIYSYDRNIICEGDYYGLGPGVNNFVGATPISMKISIAAYNDYYGSLSLLVNSSDFSAPIEAAFSGGGFNAGGKNYKRIFRMPMEPYLLWGLEAKIDDGTPSTNTGSIESAAGGTGNACTKANILANQDYNFCWVSLYYSAADGLPITPK